MLPIKVDFGMDKILIFSYPNGDKRWYLDGRLHREGGPAIEYGNGDKGWYLHGTPHRLDGPAFDFAERQTYFFEGHQISQEASEKIARRTHRSRSRINAFIRDCLLPKLYNPRRPSGYRRMMESYGGSMTPQSPLSTI